jgi:hypothetical protein
MHLTSIDTGRIVCRLNNASCPLGLLITPFVQFKSPRLVFVRASADARTHFFVMSFNSKGNLVTFVDPPSALVNSLGLFIRAVFPRRIVKEHVSDDGVFTITLNPGINGALCSPLCTVFLRLFLSCDDGGGDDV